MDDLEGKVVLVTGSGRGIGRGIGYHLANHGASLAVHYHHNQAGALALVEHVERLGHRACAIAADISVTAEVYSMVESVMTAFGRIDALVNNAAIDPREDFLAVSEEFWNRVLNTNLRGPFFCAQAVAKAMLQQGSGKIVNISSVHGTCTLPRYAAYAASKGGLNALTRQLALDLAPYHINVNAVAPGVIEVEKYSEFGEFDRVAEGKKIPWGRVGTPNDVAPLVTFLCSSASDFITGQVFTVDGGSSCRFFLWDQSDLKKCIEGPPAAGLD